MSGAKVKSKTWAVPFIDEEGYYVVSVSSEKRGRQLAADVRDGRFCRKVHFGEPEVRHIMNLSHCPKPVPVLCPCGC